MAIYKLKTASMALSGIIIMSSLATGAVDASAATKTKVTTIKKTSTVKVQKNVLHSAKTGKILKGYVIYKTKVYKMGKYFQAQSTK